MYKIFLDGELFCTPQAEELAISNPVVTLEKNKAGTFKFTVAPVHPRYDDIMERRSIFEVYRDDETEPVFAGPCMKISKDFFKQKTVECEGELTYFNDSIQRPKKYQGVSVRQLLESYVASHNAQVDEWKRFTVGVVTVKDSNDYIYCFTNNNSTMTELKEDLVDDFGGYLDIRHENGVRYLDYLADSIGRCTQPIRLGENILDYSDNIDMTQIATVVIPLGEKLEQSEVEGLDTRLTIESVNDGKDYLVSEAADTYGRISATVIFDNVTKADKLLSKGKKYLSDTQFANLVISLKAFDLSWISEQERFKLNYDVQVISKPHGLNKWMPIAKQTFNLWNPENDTLELGISQKKTLSARTATTYTEVLAAIESITPASSILESAKKNATALITSAMGGYVYKTTSELYIMDSNVPEKAKRVWRWNINGLGFSSTGINGTYGLAMTMNGQIVADFITSGAMSASRIHGGVFKAGGANNGDGKIEIYDAAGNLIAELGVTGLDVKKGKIKGTSINDTSDKFYVTANGYMHAADGDIGGLHITSSSIGDSNMGDTTVIGSSSVSSDRFKIDEASISTTYDGNLSMNSGRSLKWGSYHNAEYGDERTALSPSASSDLGTSGSKWWDGWFSGSVRAQWGVFSEGINVEGSVWEEPNKNAVISTQNYGRRALRCYETATPMFGDVGTAMLDDEGICYIWLDDVFLECINTEVEYAVFLQAYGQGDCYISDIDNTHFVVRGEPNLRFAWEIKCNQIANNAKRLEEIDDVTANNDSITILDELDYENMLNVSDDVKVIDEYVTELIKNNNIMVNYLLSEDDIIDDLFEEAG